MVEQKSNIKIELKDIQKLQHLYIDIFSEEDEDYPDHRVINNKERAVQRILDRITDKKFNQIEIWKVIQIQSWNASDNTFKPICDRLRNLGYEIINNIQEVFLVNENNIEDILNDMFFPSKIVAMTTSASFMPLINNREVRK